MKSGENVIVITKAKPLCEETYFGVASTVKNAEKLIREKYPHMRKSGDGYSSDINNEFLFFLHVETVV